MLRMISIQLFLFLLFPSLLTAQDAVQVKTNYGKVEGLINSETGVHQFLGVPFAKPPVGDLRWKSPQKPEEWNDVLEVKSFGNAPVQTNVFGDMVYRSPEKSEDCLYLNIWTPDVAPNQKLPVLVYFYGGGYVAGDASEPRYDGEALAKKGIVAITVNYRLNIFGFFVHPQLSKESGYGGSGNYGLLDQSAALHWVYENIANFGGDPRKITIGGESAGSISVSAQMASPLSKDLLAGAIGESGASIYPTLAPVALSEAEKIGADFVEKSGYTFEEFRQLSTEDLFKIYNDSGRFGFPTVLDNYFFTKSLPEVFEAGEQAQIPMLVGWNTQEMAAEGFMQELEMNVENFNKKLKEFYSDDFEAASRVYSVSADKDVRKIATAVASDQFIGYSTWKWIDLHAKNSEEPVFRYLFARVKPSEDANNNPFGAPHASEIEYFLGNLESLNNSALTKTDEQISDTIQKYLLNFIKTGDPNSKDLVNWPAVDGSSQSPSVMLMDENFRSIQAKHDDRYLFLENFFGKK